MVQLALVCRLQLSLEDRSEFIMLAQICTSSVCDVSINDCYKW